MNSSSPRIQRVTHGARRILSATAFLAIILAPVAPVFADDAPHGSGHHEHTAKTGVQSLDVYAEGGHLHLLLGEYRHETGETPCLYHRHSEDGGITWSEPVRVDTGLSPAQSPHRGMDAQIAASGDHILAAWMTKGTGLFDSGPMVLVRSDDGGKTWQPAANPADDGSTGGHGFIDIAADAAGTFHATWLDSRDGKQGLRYARSTDGGVTWSANVTAKAETCECCWNTFAVGPQGLVTILFRDKDPRDMRAAVSQDGGKQWKIGAQLGNFGWQFEGCPHVGGGIAITGTQAQPQLHAVVWTGKADQVGLYYTASADFGNSWSTPKSLGGSEGSHPNLAANSAGSLAAVWDARGEQAGIWSSTSRDKGATWSQPVRLSQAGADATHPRVLPAGNGFRVFWTEERANSGGVWRTEVVKTDKP
ncbi:sialidase family protein [Verrucomicrobiota bacterium sgz303538]